MKINRASIITIVALLAVLTCVGIYIFFFVDESEVQKRDNTPAAQALLVEGENSFTDLQGNPVSVADHFGKILIVTSWASWCPQCGDSLRDIGAVASEYKDREVVALAINRAENRYTAERFLATISVSENVKIILDPSDHYFGASSGYAMPETILYTKDGQINFHQRGNLQIDELKQHINELLK